MSEITKSIQFICAEKGLDPNIVMEAVESALGAAYRKDFGNRQQNIKVKFDPETGDMKVWDVKEVVEDITEEELEAAQAELTKRREDAREQNRDLTEEEMNDLVRYNPKLNLMITEAKEIKKTAKVGEILEISLEVPGDFGRMAAQTAKQVIIQKLREAERNVVFDDFKDQEGHIVQGVVQRRDRNGTVIIDLGKITGLLQSADQIAREQYRPGARMRFYVLSVEMGTRGPEIMLSRTTNKMVEEVFEQEIPEIAEGTVTIKDIARDPGNRSKVSVHTTDESIDPIGSCIGQRGSRITTIIDELGGEKIDMIQYTDKTENYIKEALSPAKVALVELNKETKEATAHVAADQFSLAIGRGGQNVRLAAELTGWKIKVVEQGDEGKEASSEDDGDSDTVVIDEDKSADADDDKEGNEKEEKGQEKREVNEDKSKETIENSEKEVKEKAKNNE
jgi:transcription termination/antitermination protein NusA